MGCPENACVPGLTHQFTPDGTYLGSTWTSTGQPFGAEVTMESAPTATVSETPKSMREALCAAQSALAERARSGLDIDRVPTWIKQVQLIIDQIDQHRPLRPDGKHADLHTFTCGCEGHCDLWSVFFRPGS